MIEFSCPSCQTHYRVPTDKSGARGKCKKCGAEIVVPHVSPQPPGQGDFEDPLAAMAEAARPGGGGFDAMSSRPRHGGRAADVPIFGRPFGARTEMGVRRRGLIVLGIFLLVGFMLPMCNYRRGGMQVQFVNVMAVYEEGVPLWGRVIFIAPLISGILAIGLSGLHPAARGWTNIGLGLLPVVVLFSVRQVQAEFIFAMRGSGIVANVLSLVLMLVAMYGIWVGTRVRWLRPDNPAGYFIGLIGGICIIAIMFIPFQGQVPIAASFELFNEAPFAGFLVLCLYLSWLATGILCIANSLSRQNRDASRLALLTFWIFFGGLLAFILLLMFYGIIAGGAGGRGVPAEAIFIIFGMLLKFVAWIGATFALLPMGVTDIIVGVPPRPGYCAKCGYDLHGNVSGVCPECGQAAMA